ncbi:MAG: RimK/LysX family protein [Pseudomonadota bacterium]
MIRIGVVALVWFLFAFGVQFRAEAEHMPSGPQGKLVLGWLETIVLKPWDVVLRAKLDTGANTASIDAEDITFFEKDQQTWVRFMIVKNKRSDKPDHRIEIERPVVRTILIREHFWESQQRPVVSLQFCLNGTMFEAEFNLVNRSNFKYPVLLGRRFLQNIALVDAEVTSLTHTVLRDCKRSEIIIEAKDELGKIHGKGRKPSNAARHDEPETGKLSSHEPAAQQRRRVAESEPPSRPEIITKTEDDPSQVHRTANSPSETAQLAEPEVLELTGQEPAQQEPQGAEESKIVRLPEVSAENKDEPGKVYQEPSETSETVQPNEQDVLQVPGHKPAAQEPQGATESKIVSRPDIIIETGDEPGKVRQNANRRSDSVPVDESEVTGVSAREPAAQESPRLAENESVSRSRVVHSMAANAAPSVKVARRQN